MKFFSVIGNPIMHSISPRMHNNAILFFNEEAIYTRFHLQNPLDLKRVVGFFDGVNITVPFKEYAFEIADIKDEYVCKIKSCNVLINKNNKIYAHNTDYLGFLKSIEEFKDIKSALILGAGGTSKSIAHALKSKNIEVKIANRSQDRFVNFLDFNCCLYEDLIAHEIFDIIINTTSAGLNDEQMACDKKILISLFKNSKYAYDVIYGKTTAFLQLASNCGLKIKDGKNMLLWQGVYAFELFFENHNIEEICKAMEEALQI
ncbi:shikimate dehydrogenase [Campylobacter insulaenigrae]|uniref:shikimate dehydrogenase n=1 Tax=Campylobacter insulaenigrae TaxID=260714 RepID=UPI0021520C81|nr:shikimate dehydrogenase [Campylobacter insulaenigrae]MCR6578852.1 shikimate dehydrogenase [Campylobacter insulaenigrae]